MSTSCLEATRCLFTVNPETGRCVGYSAFIRDPAFTWDPAFNWEFETRRLFGYLRYFKKWHVYDSVASFITECLRRTNSEFACQQMWRAILQVYPLMPVSFTC